MRSSILLLLLAVGVTLAYVSPDDQGLKTGARTSTEKPRTLKRQKPKPLTPQEASLKPKRVESPKKNTPGLVRRTRGAGYTSSGSGAGSFASAGSGAFNGFGGTGYQNLGFGNVAAGNGFAANQFAAYPFPVPVGVMPFDFGSFFQQLQQMQNSIQQNAINQGLSNSYGIATQEGDFGFNGFNNVNSGAYEGGVSKDGASAFANIGPQGGYGSANLLPDVGTRFGGQSGKFAPPSGGNFGVFTSSSSGSSDVNGQRKTFKTATSGINDNGKITTFTVRDPQFK